LGFHTREHESRKQVRVGRRFDSFKLPTSKFDWDFLDFLIARSATDEVPV
jgi:hypothetical protein